MVRGCLLVPQWSYGHVSSGAAPRRGAMGTRPPCAATKNLPVNQCQVLSFYLNFGLRKKGNGVNTQGLQSSCGTPPSKQENYMVRLPGCPDFTSLGLGFWGWDAQAPVQQLIQPFAGPLPTTTQWLCQMLRKDMISAHPR